MEVKSKMTRSKSSFMCPICSYIYNPEEGDVDAQIKPDTIFGKLPSDWVCPVCAADPALFEEVLPNAE